jgi:hypothetical protein
MTTRDVNSWPAQEPPADFADKALAAMMKSEQRAPSRRLDRRWVAALALAAVLATVGAFAMVEARKAREPKLPAASPTPVAASIEPRAPSPTPLQIAVAAPSASEPAPTAAVPPSAPPRAKPSASAPAAVPSATASAPDKKIRSPRCECPPSEGFCTCVE